MFFSVCGSETRQCFPAVKISRQKWYPWNETSRVCEHKCLFPKWKQTGMEKPDSGDRSKDFHKFLTEVCEEFKEKCKTEESVPLRHPNPRITPPELEGECLDWCLDYLSTRYYTVGGVIITNISTSLNRKTVFKSFAWHRRECHVLIIWAWHLYLFNQTRVTNSNLVYTLLNIFMY